MLNEADNPIRIITTDAVFASTPSRFGNFSPENKWWVSFAVGAPDTDGAYKYFTFRMHERRYSPGTFSFHGTPIGDDEGMPGYDMDEDRQVSSDITLAGIANPHPETRELKNLDFMILMASVGGAGGIFFEPPPNIHNIEELSGFFLQKRIDISSFTPLDQDAAIKFLRSEQEDLRKEAAKEIDDRRMVPVDNADHPLCWPKQHMTVLGLTA